jgi:hypothetical protein
MIAMEMKKPPSPPRLTKGPVDYCFGAASYPMFYSPSPQEAEVPLPINPSCWTPLPSYYNRKSEQLAVQGIAELFDDKTEEESFFRGVSDRPFFPKNTSLPDRTHSTSSEGYTLVREEEKCYLCMRYILPNAEPFVVLPCYDSCRSKFHFLCIVNTLWHFREAELVCPICTDPRNELSPGSSRRSKTQFPGFYVEHAGSNKLSGGDKVPYSLLLVFLDSVFSR